MASAPAGWYPDPAGAGRMRYFDGAQWTDHVSNAAAWQGIPAARSSQAAPAVMPTAAIPFGAGGAAKRVGAQRHPAVRALLFLLLAVVGFSTAVAGFIKLLYAGGTEIYTVGALLLVLAGDVGALIVVNTRAAKPAVRRLLTFLIVATVGYMIAVAGFVAQVEVSYSIGDLFKSVGALLFVVGIVGAVISALVGAAQPSPARQPYSPMNQPGGPSARRSRAPWIIAGTVAVVAVLAFALTSYALASPQVVLPFTGLNDPRGVAVDTAGAVYVVDQGNNRVLKMPAGTATPTTLPFTGLNKPSGVAVDTSGTVYVTDSGNNRVLKLAPGASTPTTLPLSGLTDPKAVAVDSAGAVYVTASVQEEGGTRGQVLKLAANASTPTTLPFAFPVTALGGPTGVAVDNAGTVYVADDLVRRLTAGATSPETLPFTFTSPGGAWGVAVDTAGNVYATDPYWQRVVKLAAGSATQSELEFAGLGRDHGVAVDSGGTVYVTDDRDRVVKLPPN